MQKAIAVRVTAFGQGQFESELPPAVATVSQALALHDVETQGRRVAVNGHPAKLGSTVVEGDEVTVVPRVARG